MLLSMNNYLVDKICKPETPSGSCLCVYSAQDDSNSLWFDSGPIRLVMWSSMSELPSASAENAWIVQFKFALRSNTPPRLARWLVSSRGVPIHWEISNTNLHFFTLKTRHTCYSQFSSSQFPGERVSGRSYQSKHCSQSAESFTSQCFRSDAARIHICRDCGSRQQFPKDQTLEWMGIAHECFILRLAPCFVATARAVLLSALAWIRNDSPISFMVACEKIISADSAPRANNYDSPRKRQQFPVLTLTRQEKSVNVTVQDVLFLVTGSPAESASEYSVMFFNCLLKSLGFVARIVK